MSLKKSPLFLLLLLSFLPAREVRLSLSLDRYALPSFFSSPADVGHVSNFGSAYTPLLYHHFEPERTIGRDLREDGFEISSGVYAPGVDFYIFLNKNFHLTIENRALFAVTRDTGYWQYGRYTGDAGDAGFNSLLELSSSDTFFGFAWLGGGGFMYDNPGINLYHVSPVYGFSAGAGRWFSLRHESRSLIKTYDLENDSGSSISVTNLAYDDYDNLSSHKNGKYNVLTIETFNCGISWYFRAWTGLQYYLGDHSRLRLTIGLFSLYTHVRAVDYTSRIDYKDLTGGVSENDVLNEVSWTSSTAEGFIDSSYSFNCNISVVYFFP